MLLIIRYRNPNHTSHVDPVKHATVRMAIVAQVVRGAGQTVYIYYDERAGVYTGYKFYSERLNKPDDFL